MSIRSFEGKTPRIHPSAYVDQDAVLIGDVEVGEECMILPGAVIRAEPRHNQDRQPQQRAG